LHVTILCQMSLFLPAIGWNDPQKIGPYPVVMKRGNWTSTINPPVSRTYSPFFRYENFWTHCMLDLISWTWRMQSLFDVRNAVNPCSHHSHDHHILFKFKFRNNYPIANQDLISSSWHKHHSRTPWFSTSTNLQATRFGSKNIKVPI